MYGLEWGKVSDNIKDLPIPIPININVLNKGLRILQEKITYTKTV